MCAISSSRLASTLMRFLHCKSCVPPHCRRSNDSYLYNRISTSRREHLGKTRMADHTIQSGEPNKRPFYLSHKSIRALAVERSLNISRNTNRKSDLYSYPPTGVAPYRSLLPAGLKHRDAAGEAKRFVTWVHIRNAVAVGT